MTWYPTLFFLIKLQIPPRASLAVCRSLFSDDIFERHNADHSLFMSQHRQPTETSCTHQPFSLSNGLVFKAIDGFAIQSRSGEFDLRIVAETPDFAVQLKNRKDNPFALAASVSDSKEDLRKMIFGRHYAEREEQRNYLLSVIEARQNDPR